MDGAKYSRGFSTLEVNTGAERLTNFNRTLIIRSKWNCRITFNPGQFQGLFVENAETEFTSDFAK